jgi:hypothetical protein
MLTRAGIDFNEDEDSIEVHAGYIGFVTIFEFDAKGSLKKMGAYE